MRFENKCVLITGGGSGIGRAAALDFAKDGDDDGGRAEIIALLS